MTPLLADNREPKGNLNNQEEEKKGSSGNEREASRRENTVKQHNNQLGDQPEDTPWLTYAVIAGILILGYFISVSTSSSIPPMPKKA